MKCKEIHKDLTAYLNEGLDAQKMHEFQSHLDICEQCNSLFQQVKSSMNLLDHPKKLEIDPFMHTRIIAQLESEEHSVSRVKQKWLQPVVLSSLILVGVVFGIGLGSRFYNEDALNQITASEFESELSDVELTLGEAVEDEFAQFLLTE